MPEGARVLVVDDDRNIRVSIAHALEASGYQVACAATGEEALAMLGASPFDLVLLDLKLPAIDGMEVLRRARICCPRAKVVIISAHGRVDSAVEAMRLGASDFVEKPFTPQEIRAAVRSALDPAPEESGTAAYAQLLAETRGSIRERRLDVALARLRRAIALEPTRPEAFNLLGAAVHLGGERYKAQSYFRAALALDPTYRPARVNLERSVGGGVRGGDMDLTLVVEGEGRE